MFEINLEGQKVLITGSSRGIGKEIATCFARCGANVAITYREREESAVSLAEELSRGGASVSVHKLDVADTESLSQLVEEVTAKLGDITTLINCAGIADDDLLVSSDPQRWRRVIDVNLIGAMELSRLCLPGMMRNRFGRIVNISSAAGMKGGRGQAAYAASKGALEAFSRSLAAEVGKRGITVNCVAPGVIETDMSSEVRKIAEKEILDRQIIKRFGLPTEIAPWCALLASPFGGFVTGQTIAIDGGLKQN